MTNEPKPKKTALEQVKEHLADVQEEKMHYSATAGIQATLDLKIAHMSLLCELAERLEAFEAKQKKANKAIKECISELDRRTNARPLNPDQLIAEMVAANEPLNSVQPPSIKDLAEEQAFRSLDRSQLDDLGKTVAAAFPGKTTQELGRWLLDNDLLRKLGEGYADYTKRVLDHLPRNSMQLDESLKRAAMSKLVDLATGEAVLVESLAELEQGIKDGRYGYTPGTTIDIVHHCKVDAAYLKHALQEGWELEQAADDADVESQAQKIVQEQIERDAVNARVRELYSQHRDKQTADDSANAKRLIELPDDVFVALATFCKKAGKLLPSAYANCGNGDTRTKSFTIEGVTFVRHGGKAGA